MKKILKSAVCLMAIFCLAAPMAFAGSFNNDPVGDDVEVIITTAGVPTASGDFTYSSSPSVSVVGFTDSYDYVIHTMNVLPSIETGYEYATVASATGYATQQKTLEPGINLTAPSALGLPSGSWTWVGGSGS